MKRMRLTLLLLLRRNKNKKAKKKKHNQIVYQSLTELMNEPNTFLINLPDGVNDGI